MLLGDGTFSLLLLSDFVVIISGGCSADGGSSVLLEKTMLGQCLTM